MARGSLPDGWLAGQTQPTSMNRPWEIPAATGWASSLPVGKRRPFPDRSANYETNPHKPNQPRGEAPNEGRNGDSEKGKSRLAQEWAST